MLKLTHIIKNWKKYESQIDNKLCNRICPYLNENQAKQTGWFDVTADFDWSEPKEWLEENIKEEIRKDLKEGFFAILNENYTISKFSFDRILAWMMILEEKIPTQYQKYNENICAEFFEYVAELYDMPKF